MSLEDIKRIMQSRCITSKTTVDLEGGEFILHPQANDILAWFRSNHPNYTLLSNGLASGRIIEAVRCYKPRHLYLSLDGRPETYRYMRGVDGYNRVIQVIEALKDEVPISLMFCLSPWNTFDDMDYVVGVARDYGLDVRIGIYGTMSFFDTTSDLLSAHDFMKRIPDSVKTTDENFDFLALYDEWRNGRLKLPCLSIRSSLVIHTNGDVPLCQNLNLLLGNIHKQTLDEIFNSRETCKIHRQHSEGCNGCWINFHRKYDIILLRSLERLFPKWIIERIYGPYRWTLPHSQTYIKYFRS